MNYRVSQKMRFKPIFKFTSVGVFLGVNEQELRQSQAQREGVLEFRNRTFDI